MPPLVVAEVVACNLARLQARRRRRHHLLLLLFVAMPNSVCVRQREKYIIGTLLVVKFVGF